MNKIICDNQECGKEIILLNEQFEDCNFNPNLEQIKYKIKEGD